MQVLTDWLLTAARVAVHLPTATAVAADLHLGYGQVRQRGGEAVPRRSVARTLTSLADLRRTHGVRRLAIAGDLVEDGRCQAGELIAELLAWMTGQQLELVGVVPGNHDRGLSSADLPLHPDGLRLGEWWIVHGDRPLPVERVVQGHEHPWLRWRAGVEGPCYLVGASHLILPACSPDAAGVNVLTGKRWGEYRCCAIAGEQVLDFGPLAALRRRRHSPDEAGASTD